MSITLGKIYIVINITAVSGIISMTCKGICIRHKAAKPAGLSRYAIGQRRCQVCDIFMVWESVFCPCCGYRLRTKPRNMNYNVKMRIRNKTAEARRSFIALDRALTN